MTPVDEGHAIGDWRVTVSWIGGSAADRLPPTDRPSRETWTSGANSLRVALTVNNVSRVAAAGEMVLLLALIRKTRPLLVVVDGAVERAAPPPT